MKIHEWEDFQEGTVYSTGYYTDAGRYVKGRDAKCISISKDREKAVFLIGRKEQEYDLIGRDIHFVEDEEHRVSAVRSETAVRPWFGDRPAYDAYSSLHSHEAASCG